jgi:hypothetical protein
MFRSGLTGWPLAALVLALATPALAEDEADPQQPAPLPHVDELVPNVSTELPAVEEILRTPEKPYPNAGDILKIYREIPLLEPSTGSVQEDQDTQSTKNAP